jgi:hypothetical protein
MTAVVGRRWAERGAADRDGAYRIVALERAILAVLLR